MKAFEGLIYIKVFLDKEDLSKIPYREDTEKGTVINITKDIIVFIDEKNEVKIEEIKNIDKIEFIKWSN